MEKKVNAQIGQEDGKPIATDDETRQLAEQFYHMMKKGNIKADDDEELPF